MKSKKERFNPNPIKKILIYGNAHSVYLKGFINALSKSEKSQIIVINTFHYADKNTIEKAKIYNCFSKYKYLNIIGLKQIIGSLSSIILSLILILKIRFKRFDQVFVHETKTWFKVFAWTIKFNAKWSSIAPWGSDYYQCPSPKNLEPLLNRFDQIHVGSYELKYHLEKDFPSFSNKLNPVYFALTESELMEMLPELQTKELNEKTNINICIGNNGSSNNQHLYILNSLSTLNESLKSRITLHLPLTYGLTESYTNQLNAAILNTRITTKTYTTFMPTDEMYVFKNSMDIFINMPQHDAFSGTMREFLFLKKKIITGSWLPYQEFKSGDFNIHFLDSINNLPDLLEQLLTFPEAAKIFDPIPREWIFWEDAIKMWLK